MPVYPLTIGSVTFNQGPFEGPNGDQGGLGDLGSKQKAKIFEFPGGIITAQLYGSFTKPVIWSGKLYGGNAISRSFELQKLCDNGQQVTFNWAQWTFDGFVHDYQSNILSPIEIEYRIVFQPLDNGSTVTGGNTLPNTDPFASALANAQNAATQQANSPASGTTLPPSVQNAVASLNQGINQALQQSGGSVSNIPTPTLQNLQGQVASIQNQLQPIINGTDPIASSGAADLSGTLGIMATAFSNSISPRITTIQAVDPNLYQLAAQYYGDPTLYNIIADENGLTDPLPITNGPIPLVIPLKPTITPPTNQMVFSDGLAAA